MEAERLRRPHEEVVEGALEWVAIAVLSLSLPLSTIRAVQHPDAYVGWFAATVLTVFWGLLLWTVMARRYGRSAAVPLQLVVGWSCLVLLLHPLTVGELPADYPPLLHALGASLCVSPIVGLRFSVAVIPFFAAYVAALRTPTLGLPAAASEAILLALSAYVAAVSVNLLRRANRSVVHAVAAATRTRERAVRAARQAYEREHWNGVIHDKVLGALQTAIRAHGPSVPAAARELAAQAVAAFCGDAPAPQPLEAALRDHADLIGLSLDLRIYGEFEDEEVRQALVDSAKEALTNVARHSGAGSARVVGRFISGSASLVIIDAGRGFDSALRPAGQGITTSLLRRMEAVDGSATVTSTPGAGTRVRLTWQARPEQAAEPDSAWQERTFAPAMVLGGLSLLMNVVLGGQRWLHDRSLAVSLGGIVTIVVLTAAVTWGAPQDRRLAPLFVTTTVTMALLTANIAEGAPTDWRYWYVGALTPAIGALAFRYRRFAGLGLAAALTVSVCGVDVAMGRPVWACLSGPVPVLFAVAAAGQEIRSAMDRAWLRVSEAEAEGARRRLAVAVEEERSMEAAARIAALADAVAPVMTRLASGHDLEQDEQARLALLEGSIRDHLAVPDLLDARLVRAISESRARGVRVVVVAGVQRSGSPEGTAAGSTTVYRTILAHVLTAAPAGAMVRAVWASGGPGHTNTITLVAAGVPKAVSEDIEALVAEVPAPARPQVSQDEEALLVDLQA